MRTCFLRSHLRGLLAAVLLLFASAAPAAAQNLVYAVETGQNVMCGVSDCHGPVVHVINAATGHDLATIALPGSSSATSLRISSDRRTLFATSTGIGSPAGRLFVIDALGRRVAGQVVHGASAVDVAVLPDNSRAYVVDKTGNSVMVVDLSSLAVVATIPVQTSPLRIVVSPTGNALYVANFGSSSISKISTTTNTVEATIGVGAGPVGLDISPDGSRLFVANSGDRTVTVIDANVDSVLRVIPTSGGLPSEVSAPSPSRVFLTLDSQTNSGNSFLQLLNAADGAVLGSTQIKANGRLARDASGTPTYLVETTTSGAIKLVASDATSTTTLATGPNSGLYTWNAAAVATDPCTFEATAAPAVFGPSGGTGVLTIPAPAGCSWTIDPNGFPGLSVAAPLSGTGPATRTFTVPSTSIPRVGAIVIGQQSLTIDQTIPRMNVEFASGATVQQPFTIGGWALDESAIERSGPGVDFLHVWAYPAGGASPIFIGVASYGIDRPDVGALFGITYQLTGFSVVVSNLPSGSYTIVVFAHSSRSNTFSNAQAVNVSVVRQPAMTVIDTPTAGAVGTTFRVAGWAVDPAAAGGGPGVDVVHVWAYPPTGASPMFVGEAVYGGARPDVAAYFGPSFTNCGFGLTGSLPPGSYTLVVFARSIDTRQFTSQTVRISVQ